MKSTVETLSPTRVRFEIEVPFGELEPAVKRAYRMIGAQVTVPGFRKGKVPPPVIDQRIGRNTVLTEAVQEAIPEQLIAAVRQHELRTIGRPTVEITEYGDGKPLRFTAEVDVRPEISLPELSGIEVTVDAVRVADSEVDEQLEALRMRFATLKTVERPAQVGDFVLIDLAATVNGKEVPGGSASNLSYEVGTNQLLPGLDETVMGMSAGESATFVTKLVGGEYAGQDADVEVKVRTVRERELPALDDEFAQLASEFDTLEQLRSDLRERLTRVKRIEQLYQARDRALDAVIAATDVPTPQSVVEDEVEARKRAMTEQLERMGSSLEAYLASENKTEEDLTKELTAAAERAVRIQLLLDAFADADDVKVSDEEFGHEVVHRANRAGVSPQQYYDQLARSGAAAAVYGDVRRGKALQAMLERMSIKDSDGAPVSLDELRGGESPGGTAATD